MESIKKQSYSPIELLVSDDCSKDDTLAVAQRWISENQSEFHAIRLLQAGKNTGIAKNINRACRAASVSHRDSRPRKDWFLFYKYYLFAFEKEDSLLTACRHYVVRWLMVNKFLYWVVPFLHVIWRK